MKALCVLFVSFLHDCCPPILFLIYARRGRKERETHYHHPSAMTSKGPNDPEMQKKEKMLTYTVAMGMKMSRVSAQCWVDSCEKEARIRDEWQRVYDPQWQEREDAIISSVMEREQLKKSQPWGPERKVLYDGVSKDGKGRAAYLKARHNMDPQQKSKAPMSMSQMVGWACREIPPLKDSGLPSYGHKPVIKNGFYRRTGVM